MIERTIFYDAGPVITKASFIGFCRDECMSECKHAACGYKEPHRVCPKCGRQHEVTAYDYSGHNNPKEKGYNPSYGKKLRTRECTPKDRKEWNTWKPCGFDIEKAPIKDGKKVKCTMARFRSYTTEELANPATTDIRYALIEVEFAATQGKHLFVADLEDVDFINHEMTVNENKKGWLAYTGSFSVPVNIDKIANKADVIKQIGKVFGQ